MITPAPKNPIPVTSPCTTRLVAAGSWPVLSKAISVTRAVLRDTKACVRIPGGFPTQVAIDAEHTPHQQGQSQAPHDLPKSKLYPKIHGTPSSTRGSQYSQA